MQGGAVPWTVVVVEARQHVQEAHQRVVHAPAVWQGWQGAAAQRAQGGPTLAWLLVHGGLRRCMSCEGPSCGRTPCAPMGVVPSPHLQALFHARTPHQAFPSVTEEELSGLLPGKQGLVQTKLSNRSGAGARGLLLRRTRGQPSPGSCTTGAYGSRRTRALVGRPSRRSAAELPAARVC